MAAQGSDEARSLRTATDICLASPVAACVAAPDGRIHVFNAPWRALFGASERISGELDAALASTLAGTGALIEVPFAGDTVRLALIPLRDEATQSVRGALISLVQSAPAAAAQQIEAFRYTLAHDLLSPLRTLQQMAQILEHEHAAHLPPEAAAFLGHFTQGTSRLTERVEALVRLVQLNAQPLNCRRVDIAQLVREVVAGLRARHGERATVVIGELPEAQVDAELARQLFANLLSNAFKFSRHVSEPRIEIGCEARAARNGYFVMDNGAGFDMKYAGKLFGLFQRMHAEAQFEGTGAGLAMARSIVERHGGTIRAEAMKDQGAKFLFTLPSASPGAHRDA